MRLFTPVLLLGFAIILKLAPHSSAAFVAPAPPQHLFFRRSSLHAATPITMRQPSRTRPPVPAPPPGAPAPFETFKRWTLVQLSADSVSVCVLCFLTGKTPIELYFEQNVLLWVLLGPALITFGAVWARITQTGAAEKYGEDDFFVQKLGGADAVASLRYTISNALRF